MPVGSRTLNATWCPTNIIHFQVMEQFRDVYTDRQKALGNPSPIVPKAKNSVQMFKDKDAVYQIALEAAQRKPDQPLELEVA